MQSTDSSLEFPAANNLDSACLDKFPANGHWPIGRYPFAAWNRHSDDGPNSAFGSFGILTFTVPDHSGLGVHSGRRDVPDGRGRKGKDHCTEGCVRTDDDSMRVIVGQHQIDHCTFINVTA